MTGIKEKCRDCIDNGLCLYMKTKNKCPQDEFAEKHDCKPTYKLTKEDLNNQRRNSNEKSRKSNTRDKR